MTLVALHHNHFLMIFVKFSAVIPFSDRCNMKARHTHCPVARLTGLFERHDGLVAQGAQQGQLFLVQFQRAMGNFVRVNQAER